MPEIQSRLAPFSDTPGLDAQVLLAHLLGKSRAWLLAHPEAALSDLQHASLSRMLERLENREPLPYVLGQWEFFGLSFAVGPEVLIPRPETELLVERALAWLERSPAASLALDSGTGSGCIAVSLAVRRPNLSVIAVDLSSAALHLARHNAVRHAVAGRISFVQADLLPPTHARFHLICANLPYIPTRTLSNLPIYGREPTLALDGGPSGLSLIQKLLQTAPQRLAPGGLALLEIEASQGQSAQRLAKAAFPAAQVSLHQDLAGRDRLIEIQNAGILDSFST